MTVAHLGGEDINGTYLFDPKAFQRNPPPVVEDGSLVGFLMSRSPSQTSMSRMGWPQVDRAARHRSNGHPTNRRERIEAQLRKMLLAQVQDQG